MAASRPTVNVQGSNGAQGSVPLPAVFSAPVRTDLVQEIYKNMAKNKRQPYAVATNAGHQTSAESWGTGRAVARIPRVGGGGTHRSGQAAFGNMVRGGHMFAPTKLWRRWHVKTNQKQKRYAVASALAATAIPSLLLARGHRVEQVAEVPCVVEDSVQNLTKTKEAVALLQSIKAYDDVVKVSNSRKLRAGQGKLRNRRHVQRRGPLVVYEPAKDGKELVAAFRNIPGVECCDVYALNLLQLAPGGHLGRFVIWSSNAFAALDSVYGSTTEPSELKRDFLIPQNSMAQPDLNKLINSSEVQSVLRPVRGGAITKRSHAQKKNPLQNKQVMLRLNPYAAAYKKQGLGQQKADEKAINKDKTFEATLHEN